MGKKFKVLTKLSAKFLVALMVIQATLFSFTAFADTLATSVTIKKGSITAGTSLLAFLGTNLTLTSLLTPVPTTATYKANTWSSSAPEVATITYATGGLTATFIPVSEGTTTIAVYNTKSGVSKTVAVTVYTKLTGFSITPATLTINKGEYAQIASAVLSPSSLATVSSTTYSIPSTTTTVKINTTNGVDTVAGAVYGVKGGTALVTVKKTLPDGTSLSKTVLVTVAEPVVTVVIKKGTTTPTTLGIDATKTIVLTGSVTPTNATYKTLRWESSNTDYATVSATGAVYAKPAGIGQQVTVTATAYDTTNSAADSVTFTVYQALKTATLAKSTISMKIGTTKNISAYTVLTPADASVTSITYSATGAATADSSGIITAGSAAGKAVITITITRHDGVKKLLINVNVSKAVTGISIRPAAKSIKVYESATLTPVFAPTDVTYKKVTYTSSNPAVAFVNPRTGVVTGLAVGTATITGTPAGNGAVSAISTITVTDNFED